ncbi:hypothetical protein B0H17DRAFT_1124663 [Mycena rosella]|uniref:Uncharacterized protein n=1 Tax=Mycena rosella TaxID=1033263 RepID=A0AAD7H047_MYCRO|nr:hypothetical protein B0H17DRAFT_1124663 [Mycena rosella]
MLVTWRTVMRLFSSLSLPASICGLVDSGDFYLGGENFSCTLAYSTGGQRYTSKKRPASLRNPKLRKARLYLALSASSQLLLGYPVEVELGIRGTGPSSRRSSPHYNPYLLPGYAYDKSPTMLSGTTACELEASRSQIISAWIFLLDELAMAMDELQRLCSSGPFSHAHLYQPSMIPHIVLALDPRLRAELPKAFFDCFPMLKSAVGLRTSKCNHPGTHLCSAPRSPDIEIEVLTPSAGIAAKLPAHTIASVAARKLSFARTSSFVEAGHLEARSKRARVAATANGRWVPELRAGMYFNTMSIGHIVACADKADDAQAGCTQSSDNLSPLLSPVKSHASSLVNDEGLVERLKERSLQQLAVPDLEMPTLGKPLRTSDHGSDICATLVISAHEPEVSAPAPASVFDGSLIGPRGLEEATDQQSPEKRVEDPHTSESKIFPVISASRVGRTVPICIAAASMASSSFPASGLINAENKVELGGPDEENPSIHAELIALTQHNLSLTAQRPVKDVATPGLHSAPSKACAAQRVKTAAPAPGSRSKSPLREVAKVLPLLGVLKASAPAFVKNKTTECGGLKESRQQRVIPEMDIHTSGKGVPASGSAPSDAPVTMCNASVLERVWLSRPDLKISTVEMLPCASNPPPGLSAAAQDTSALGVGVYNTPAPAPIFDGGSVELGGLTCEETPSAAWDTHICNSAKTSFAPALIINGFAVEPRGQREDRSSALDQQLYAPWKHLPPRSLLANATLERENRTHPLRDFPGLCSKLRPRDHTVEIVQVMPSCRILKLPAPAVTYNKAAIELGELKDSRQQLPATNLKVRTWEKSACASASNSLPLSEAPVASWDKPAFNPGSFRFPPPILVSDGATVELEGPQKILPPRNEQLVNAEATSVLTSDVHASFASESLSPLVFHSASATEVFALVSTKIQISWISYNGHFLSGDVAPDME